MENLARNGATAANIQQLEDGPLNPLNQKAWPGDHEAILEVRRSLPVYGECQRVLDIYHENQVFVLSSGTGSGKSTQVPQFVLYDELASGLRVVCTQPRRLAATAVAGRVAQEMGVELGHEVGYKIGGDNQTSEKTRLFYVTEGVVLNEYASDPTLSKYACVIIDEAHERTVEVDLLLAMLKKALRKRKDLKVSTIFDPDNHSLIRKVIVMSATVDAGKFTSYYDGCPLLHLPGRNFDVRVLYAEHKTSHNNMTA